MTRESREALGCVPGAIVEAVSNPEPSQTPDLTPENLSMAVAQ